MARTIGSKQKEGKEVSCYKCGYTWRTAQTGYICCSKCHKYFFIPSNDKEKTPTNQDKPKSKPHLFKNILNRKPLRKCPKCEYSWKTSQKKNKHGYICCSKCKRYFKPT